MPEVTLLDIARRLGVSKTAVSLALRGKPGISEATVKLILQTAEEMGYSPNPVVAELMSMVRTNRQPTGTQVIAFVNTYADPSLLYRNPGTLEFVEGAKPRAQQYGYQVEIFHAREKGMTEERLADIFTARGIRGILLGPRWRGERLIELPWGRFATVVIGQPEGGPRLQRVSSHHGHAMLDALHAIAAKGYQTVGLALPEPFVKSTGLSHLWGAEQFRQEAGQQVRTPIWLYEQWNPEEAADWAEREQIDAVICLDGKADFFSQRQGPDGATLGYAGLSVFPEENLSGIDQHFQMIGSAAVDLLRGLLLEGARGLAPRPQILLVDGEWTEGITTPGRGISYVLPGRKRP